MRYVLSMGDIVGDVAGLSAPLTKLVEVVGQGIGRLYEPTHIRRMAKAHRYALEQLGEPVTSAHAEMEIRDAQVSLSLKKGDPPSELEVRASESAGYRQARGQQNTENVINVALEATLGLDPDSGSEEEVSEDWIGRFFQEVQTVSSEQMQLIWGRILAGEVNRPGSFSLRTLDVVRNLSVSDARNFEKALEVGFRFRSVSFLYSPQAAPIDLGVLISLEEAGLVISNNLHLKLQAPTIVISDFSGQALVAEVEKDVQIPAVPLTTAGAELAHLSATRVERQIFDSLLPALGKFTNARFGKLVQEGSTTTIGLQDETTIGEDLSEQPKGGS